MKPAVQRALAYCLITGGLPSHIHLDTWSAAFSLTEGEPAARRPVPEVLDKVRRHPMVVAHEYLLARGWKLEPRHRRMNGRARTSHYVCYVRDDSPDEALAGREGAITLTQVRDCVPYRQSTHLTWAQVKAG